MILLEIFKIKLEHWGKVQECKGCVGHVSLDEITRNTPHIKCLCADRDTALGTVRRRSTTFFLTTKGRSCKLLTAIL